MPRRKSVIIKKLSDKELEDIIHAAVLSGYNAKDLGLSEDQAVHDTLMSLRRGTLMGLESRRLANHKSN